MQIHADHANDGGKAERGEDVQVRKLGSLSSCAEKCWLYGSDTRPRRLLKAPAHVTPPAPWLARYPCQTQLQRRAPWFPSSRRTIQTPLLTSSLRAKAPRRDKHQFACWATSRDVPGWTCLLQSYPPPKVKSHSYLHVKLTATSNEVRDHGNRLRELSQTRRSCLFFGVAGT